MLSETEITKVKFQVFYNKRCQYRLLGINKDFLQTQICNINSHVLPHYKGNINLFCHGSSYLNRLPDEQNPINRSNDLFK